MMEDIVTFDATYRCIAMILPLSYVAGNKCDTLFEASCAMYEADPALRFFLLLSALFAVVAVVFMFYKTLFIRLDI